MAMPASPTSTKSGASPFVEKIAFDKLHFLRLPHDRVEVVARQRVADHSAPRCAISPPLGRQAYYGRAGQTPQGSTGRRAESYCIPGLRDDPKIVGRDDTKVVGDSVYNTILLGGL